LSEGTPEGGGKPGSPFLWFLSFGDAKERNLQPSSAKTARKGERLAAYSLRVQPSAVLTLKNQ